jgi:hypothetical protein
VYAFADGLKTIDADLIAQLLRDRKGAVALSGFAADSTPVRITNGG